MIVTLATFVGGCVVLQYKPPTYEFDPVCRMKVAESDAYTFKYQGKEYYFDKINCKEAFKMNPEKFLHSSCDTLQVMH